MTQLPTESVTEDLATGFRSLMAGFPTGVAIVAAVGSDGKPIGMTCSSLCSVTLKPPTLLLCLRNESPTLRSIVGNGGFAVNLLHARAQATAQLFASGKADRFDQVRWQLRPGDAGPHLVDDAHAVAHCALDRTERVGDHVVIFGKVFSVWQSTDRQPLLYGLRRYTSWPTH